MNPTLLLILVIVVLVVLCGVGVALLFEWRLRAHLGDARKIVSSLRAHLDSFDASWNEVREANKTTSDRITLLNQRMEPLEADVHRHDEILRKLRLT